MCKIISTEQVRATTLWLMLHLEAILVTTQTHYATFFLLSHTNKFSFISLSDSIYLSPHLFFSPLRSSIVYYGEKHVKFQVSTGYTTYTHTIRINQRTGQNQKTSSIHTLQMYICIYIYICIAFYHKYMRKLRVSGKTSFSTIFANKIIHFRFQFPAPRMPKQTHDRNQNAYLWDFQNSALIRLLIFKNVPFSRIGNPLKFYSRMSTNN